MKLSSCRDELKYGVIIEFTDCQTGRCRTGEAWLTANDNYGINTEEITEMSEEDRKQARILISALYEHFVKE